MLADYLGRKRMFINGVDYEHNPENKMMQIMPEPLLSLSYML